MIQLQGISADFKKRTGKNICATHDQDKNSCVSNVSQIDEAGTENQMF